MWNKLSEHKPDGWGPYFVYNDETGIVFVLDYKKEYDEFGIDTYGDWQPYDGIISQWQEIKYPLPPGVREVHSVTWQKDRADVTGKTYRYYTETNIETTK